MTNLPANPPQIKQKNLSSPAPDAKRRRAELRQLLDESAWGLAITCDTLRNYLVLQQDFMVGFSVRQIIACARMLRDTAKLLEAERRLNDPELQGEDRHGA